MSSDNGRASTPLKSSPSSHTIPSPHTALKLEHTHLADGHASSSPSTKTVECTSDSQQAQPTVVLERGFFRGLVSCSWIIHFVSVLFTAGIVQFTFRRVYWFDEDNWDSQWMSKLKISQDFAVNGLQFVAKIHEIIIVASVSAMAMQFCRRMLVGEGIPFGFLSGAYQVSSVEWLFSKVCFWATMPRRRKREMRGYVSSWRRVLLGLGAAALCIYCNMVGPSSAIAIIPGLEWRDVLAPFEGRLIGSYIATEVSHIYPSTMSNIDIEECQQVENATNKNDLTWCPDGGGSELLKWAKTLSVGGPSSPMDVTQPESGVRREITSSTMGLEEPTTKRLTFLARNTLDLLAVATTPHSSLTELGGRLWSYLEAHNIAGVQEIKRPQIALEEDVRAPLVQVQCSMIQYHDAWHNRTSNYPPPDPPQFDSRAMRNFSALARGELDFCREGEDGRGRWPIPEAYWNYTRDNESLRRTNFSWVDVASLFPTKRPSLGSVLEVPMMFVDFLENKAYQGSLTIPCLMDVRWAGVELSLDPAIDRLFRHNMSDLTKAIGGFWDTKKKMRKNLLWALSDPNVPISLPWADLLNKPVESAVPGTSQQIRNTTAVEALFDNFLSFYPPLFGKQWAAKSILEVPDSIGRTVATILVHTLVDGLSRVSFEWDVGLALEAHNNGTITCVSLSVISGGMRGDEVLLQADDMAWLLAFHWKLRKYGYGYGLDSRTTMFGVAILLIHAGAVVVYASYVLYFRLSPYGWSSSAWGSLDGMLLLAIKSRPSDAARYAGTGIMSKRSVQSADEGSGKGRRRR